MASRKAVTTIEKDVKEKAPKKATKKAVVTDTPTITTLEEKNDEFIVVDDSKKYKATSGPKKAYKKADAMESFPSAVLENDINDEEEVVEKELTFIDKVAAEPSKTMQKSHRKKPRSSKNKGNITNNRILISRGLTSKMVEERVKKGLVNKSKRSNTKSIFRIIVGNILTVFNLINLLMFVLLVSVGSFQNCFFMIIIAINTVIGIVQEIKAKKTIDSLSIVNTPSVEVMRNGRLTKIKSEDVVIDDICYFHTGKQICADSTVRKGVVEVNESLLTGESELVVKKVGSTLYAGSFIVSGECYAKVDKVGSDNFIEQISSKVKYYSKPKSEIMNSLKVLIRIISVTVIIMAFAVFYFNYNAAKVLYPDDAHKAYVEAVVATGGSVIGMIPSGLFLMTSISLAAGVLKLAKHRTVVQDMYCIEMLSRVDVMCLDKTGTITDGTMKVKEVNELNEMKSTVRQIISTLSGVLKESSPTAIALQKRFGVNKKAHYRYTVPFSSARKYSAVYFDDHELSYILGAPEFIMKERYSELEYEVYRYSKLGYRVLLLASSPTKCKDQDCEFQDITPLALIAIEDTIRKDAVETINYFKNSGVEVKVISGDNPVTVSKIAKRAGVEDAEKYISLEDRGEDDLEDLVKNYTMFGRVSPNQKQMIIKYLKEQGHTVAMTGDGVNDILALKEADCSIAMANGSDAARSASHMILLDSNFSSMPKVVMEGRRVINNIKRVSTMYLTKTIFSFLLSVVFIVMNSFKPTTYPIQPIYLLPFDWFIVTIPSFYLALEKNNKRISGKFMSDILLNALPGAILIVVNYLVISIAGSSLLELTPEMITASTVYSIIIIGVLVLHSIFKPFSLKRAVFFTLDMILLLVLVFLSPYVTLENGVLISEYFGLHNLNISAVMMLIIIAQYSYIILKSSGKVFSNVKNVMKNFNNDSE